MRSDNEEWCDFAGLKYSDSIIQKYFLNNLLLHDRALLFSRCHGSVKLAVFGAIP